MAEPKEEPKQKESAPPHADSPIDFQPVRTLQGDILKLLKNKKISKDDLKRAGRQLRTEVERHEKQGGDENITATLDLFKKEKTLIQKAPKKAHKEGDDGVDTFIARTKHGLVTDEISKSRKRTEELKQEFLSPEGGVVEGLPQEETPTSQQSAEPIKQKVPQIPVIRPASHHTKEEESLPSVGGQAHEEDLIQEAPVAPPKKVTPPPPPPKPKPRKLTEEEKLKREIASVERELSALPQKERVLQENIDRLTGQKDRLSNFIEPLIKKEAELEQKEVELDEAERRVSDPKERQQLEKSRWVLEDHRKEAEQKRWKADQEIIKIQGEIDDVHKRLIDVSDSRNEKEQELEGLKKHLRALAAEKEKKVYKEQLAQVEKAKEPLELEWITLNEQKEALSKAADKAEREEEGIEAKKKDIEEQEREALDPQERHNFEVERWKAEEARRAIEKSRWQAEERLEQIEDSLQTLRVNYKKLLDTESSLQDKLQEIDLLVSEVEKTP